MASSPLTQYLASRHPSRNTRLDKATPDPFIGKNSRQQPKFERLDAFIAGGLGDQGMGGKIIAKGVLGSMLFIYEFEVIIDHTNSTYLPLAPTTKLNNTNIFRSSNTTKTIRTNISHSTWNRTISKSHESRTSTTRPILSIHTEASFRCKLYAVDLSITYPVPAGWRRRITAITKDY